MGLCACFDAPPTRPEGMFSPGEPPIYEEDETSNSASKELYDKLAGFVNPLVQGRSSATINLAGVSFKRTFSGEPSESYRRVSLPAEADTGNSIKIIVRF